MDSPDLPEPHPDDPWHPAWTPDADSPAATEADLAETRITGHVQRLTQDEEDRVGLEAAAAGRRMLDQITAARAGDAPQDPRAAQGRDVARSEGVAVPESEPEASRGWLGRLWRRGETARVAARSVAHQEEPEAVDEVRADDGTGPEDRPDDAPSDAASEVGPSEVGPSEVVSSEVVSSEVAPSETGATEDDFPWDDEDWSTARTADDPPFTLELDLGTEDRDGSDDEFESDTEPGAAEPVGDAEGDDSGQADSADDVPVRAAVVPDARGDGEPDDSLPDDGDEVARDRSAADVATGDVSDTESGDVVTGDVESGPVALGATADADPPDTATEAIDDTDDEFVETGDESGDDTPPVPDSADDVSDVDGSEVDESEVDGDEVGASVVGAESADEAADEQPPDQSGDDDAIEPLTMGDDGDERMVDPDDVPDDDGVFTHAEVIPLVRPPQIEDHEASAGLDPDLLAPGDAEADPVAVDASDEEDPEDGGSRGDQDPGMSDASGEGGPDSGDADEEFAAFSIDDYTGTATEEYAELARAVAESETETLELAAVSAEMPGLDTSLVGLDDVVDAGIGVTETLSTTRRSDLGLRVATAIGLLIVFFGSLLWSWAIGGLILVVLAVAALELYIVTVNAGYRPLTWAGLVGVLGALIGTWIWGVIAVPIALALTAIGATLFLALSSERRTPLLDLALTIAMMAWIGVLGAPAFEIVEAADYRWLILAIVLTTAFMDVAQYFVGRSLGRRRLSPVVSPKKTIEGLVGGIFTALVVGVAFGSIEASPFDPGSGLALGATVALVAPLGDLAVSVVKRALDVKDMGAILPGHGGIMDRIDAMVFVIPSAWILYRYFDLLG